jgi:hypothetical protein
MSAYSLDSIDPLWVHNFSGFNLPDDITAVGILGDGSSAFNAVLQSPGTRLPEAQLTGEALESADVAALRALRLSEAQVTFTEPLGSHNVVVSQLKVDNDAGMPWPWSLTLIELP